MWETVARNTRCRTLVDAAWDMILGGRTVLLSDFNVHSPQCNIPCGERRVAVGLETLIKIHDL